MNRQASNSGESLAQHDAGKVGDPTVFFGERDELGGRDDAETGMAPSGQNFEAFQMARAQLDERLKDGEELVAFQCTNGVSGTQERHSGIVRRATLGGKKNRAEADGRLWNTEIRCWYKEGAFMTLIPTAPPYVLSSSRYGLMLVNSKDVYMGLAYLKYGECCQIETDFLLSLLQSSGLVVEVGSNMGVHTVPIGLELARQGRKMLAFEPQRVIFQQLCANLALNGLMNVIAMPYACGAEAGSVSFTEPNYRELGNFGATEMSTPNPSSEPPAAVQSVACFTLDSFVAHEDVALIKIDVEGFELAVLQGAVATLERSKPLLYVENDRASTSEELIDRKSTRLNSSHSIASRMPSSA